MASLPPAHALRHVGTRLRAVRRQDELQSVLAGLAADLELAGLGAMLRGPRGTVLIVTHGLLPTQVEALAANVVPVSTECRVVSLHELPPELRAPLAKQEIATCLSALACWPGGADGRLVALVRDGKPFDESLPQVLEVLGLELASTNERILERAEFDQSATLARDCQDALLEALPGPVLRLDTRGVVLAVNSRAHSFATELSIGKSLGHTWGDAQLAAALEQRRPWRGRRGTVELMLEPTSTAKGHACGFLARLAHVPSTERDQDRASQSNRLRAMGTLLTLVAHDLNNLLAPVVLALEAREGLGDDAERTYLADAAAQAGEIVRELLDFGRGTPSLPVPVNVTPTIERALAFTQRALPPTIQVTTELHEVGAAQASVNELYRAVVNLVLNAREAMPAGGELRVVLREEWVETARVGAWSRIEPGHWVVIEVKDTGEGISATRLPYLFTLFETSRYEAGGSGLGLAMVREALERCGGACTVDSAVAQGTTVRLYLRAAKVSRATPTP